ncbi:baseplate multidomain protein megatron [Hyphomicrobium sp.]|uniref:baseplate multidomain protein megatron n=1 Tax=Hyphomicrobium sp. TaxID=82 RepID=UPI002D7946F2|nr:glycoside hydrolase/phage tail family protein [Hyphomicrobium sp.]HET6390800.1 glycoside hydrolase/phage tail family protein [Hyphomicrobium sp.]
MATLALAAAGAAIGASAMPAGFGLLGMTISGATIGSQIGALAGSYVDNALFAPSGQARAVEGPRLSDLRITSSTEGAPLPKIYGRARVGGQIIWATDLEEEITTTTQAVGSGKGGGSGAKAKTTQYGYYANFAVALAEGVVTRIGRIWADEQELDRARTTFRLHTGTETQEPDSLIAAREGADNAPAYRGVAYVVFEHFALADYGNRVPQLTFEVFRSVGGADQDVRGVVMIPGSGEFVYATQPVHQTFEDGVSQSENVHQLLGPTDWEVSLDQLEESLPNAKSVSLVVSWFGTDLRAGECKIRPGVETRHKSTAPLNWSVAGTTRSNAYLISTRDGNAAYGGTPSDQTVVAAINDMNARGLSVTLTPFILMDVPASNSLADPYGGGSQPAYPWRGRITCHPAPGQSGTPDKTTAAASQIASFVGTAARTHFTISGTSVLYSGPDEWSYRRMILHQAYLAKAAGGVDAFVIGTELRGLTWVRSNANTYPFVTALIALAADVKAILGPSTKVLYAADWTEYFGHQPGDGSGDVYFHLDPLWASSNIDAIGIDVYWPLADWREGRDHLDALAGATSIYDPAYLRANVHGGEGFDWYYASDADRDAQIRTPITDGAGKPWVYRYKDIRSWWSNAHYNRPGGVENTTPTAWVPESKPFWFMEIGCPAVDKGANQPNVFVDPKSSESALPYYSRGLRDDLMQARHRQAMCDAFDWTKPGYVEGANPVSAVTGTRMVDLSRIHVYCWDARPYPAFPDAATYWGDSENWAQGHWINGRLGGAALADVVSAILLERGFTDFDTSNLTGTVPGYVIDRTMSARDAIQPLELAYFFDSIESEGRIVFRHRGRAAPAVTLEPDDLVEESAGDALYELTRAQETDLPASAKVRYISGLDDYPQAVAEARRLTGASGRLAEATLPIVLDDDLAGAMAESWLYETWASRESAAFKLPPSALALEPGDIVAANIAGRSRLLRLTDVSEHGVRDMRALSIDPDVYDKIDVVPRAAVEPAPVQAGAPAVALLDLPQWNVTADESAGYVAAMQKSWPGSVAIFASPQETGYQLKAIASAPATIGVTLDDLGAGPEGRIDHRASVRVRVTNGTLSSVDQIAMLAGANLAALRGPGGDCEIFQFQTAELVDAQTYRLSGLLRGQFGTEDAMAHILPAGAQFVLLDGAVASVPLRESERKVELNWRCGPGNRDIGDESYVTVPFAYQALGLRPLSPVHVKATRAAGDIEISWARRTRSGGDSWEAPEVPLAEESESYEVDILDGATVKRTLTSSSPSVIYASADQISDFGSEQSSVSIKVYQTNVIFGRSAPRAAIV